MAAAVPQHAQREQSGINLESQHQQPDVASKEKPIEIGLPTSALVTVPWQKRQTLKAPIRTREPFLSGRLGHGYINGFLSFATGASLSTHPPEGPRNDPR